MKSKLFQVKNSLALKMQKLSEEELSFITGGYGGSGGSSGTGSGSTCDAVTVHCCYPDLPDNCH